MRIAFPVTLITIISFLAVAFLFWLIYAVEFNQTRIDFSFLPSLNAGFNSISSILICFGIWQIKKGNSALHGKLMIGAFTSSTLFLFGYILHHSINGDTKFLGEGLLRVSYFTILISHIILSAFTLPLVLNTVYFALTKQFEIHKKFARWTYPLWLYVSVTGVIIYFYLRYLNPS